MNGVCLSLCIHYFLSPDGKNLHDSSTQKKLKDEGEWERKTFDKKQMRIYG